MPKRRPLFMRATNGHSFCHSLRGWGAGRSVGVLYAEAAAALYESDKRPLVLSFMAGMGGEAIVLKEFYWMTEKMMSVPQQGKIEKGTHWVGFEVQFFWG